MQPARQNVKRPPGGKAEFERYITEHVLEAQLLKEFMKDRNIKPLCKPMERGGFKKGNVPINGVPQNPWDYIGGAYPSDQPGGHGDEMNIIIESVNLVKENAFKLHRLPGEGAMAAACKSEDTVDKAIRTMKNIIMTYKYMKEPTINDIFVDQVNRVADRFEEAENAVRAFSGNTYTTNDLKNKWKTFMRTRTTQVISKFHQFFDTWIVEIEKVLEGTDEEEDVYFPGRADRREKIKTLREVVDDVKNTWTNPF